MHKEIIICGCPPADQEGIAAILKEQGVSASFVDTTEPRRQIGECIGHVPHHGIMLRSMLAGALREVLLIGSSLREPPVPSVDENLLKMAAEEMSMIDLPTEADIREANIPFWREIGQNSKKARRAFQSKIKPTPRR